MNTLLDSPNLLISRNVKLKNPYKIVFILFKVSSVFPISFKQRKSCRAKILSWYGIVILVLFTLPNVGTLWTMGLSSISIGTVSVNGVSILQRFLLGKKLKRLRNIARFMQQSHQPKNSKISTWVYAWAFVSTALHIVLIALSILAMWEQSTSKVIGVDDASDFTRILMSAFATANVLFFVLPVNTYSIFYVLVCLQMKEVMHRFVRSVRAKLETNTDFRVLLPAYRSIKGTVGFLDSELSFLMLCSVVFSSLLMFMAVSLVLHPNPVFIWPMKGSIFTYFAISQASFLAMTAAASAVNEASAEVADAAEGMPEESRECMEAAKQRFLSATQNEVAFTVWKIVPIKRNFIVGTLGAIFTYVILIDGLKFT